MKWWYSKNWSVWSALLWPLSILFYFATIFRVFFYRYIFKAKYKINTPIIVVGNITVGGTGKSPLIIALAQHLVNRGLSVGVISRGYGSKSRVFPLSITADTQVSDAGDEPKMISSRLNIPVVIDPNRPRAAVELIKQHSVDVILSDDGLQHYALPRALELMVIDGNKRFGNEMLLPAGPLREPIKRLKTVDEILVQGKGQAGEWSFILEASSFVSLKTGEAISLSEFSARFMGDDNKVHLKALCAIGSPERFFKQLENLGYHLESVYQWQDHYNYVENDLKRISEYILYKNAISVMTEKDAVKIKPLLQKLNFLNNTDDCWWYLKVDASLPEEWWDKFDKLIDNILS